MQTHAHFWDRIAADYAKKPLPNPEATAKKLALTRAVLRPEHRLLDLGCGTGTILLALAPYVAEAHGVDLSPAMIAIAEEKATGVPNVRFRVEPAGTLDAVPDATYDCVCAYNLLHLVPDPAELVRAVHRVLKPGGAFVSATACLGGTWLPPYGLILPMLRWIGKAPLVTLLTRQELHDAVEGAGFVRIETPAVGGSAPDVFMVARKPGGG